MNGTSNSNEGGRVIPAAFLRSLRGLLGREASPRQQGRIITLQRQFDLAPGDSIFIVVAILELYLQQVEAACIDVRRSTRRTLLTACLTAVVSSALVVAPLYVVDPNIRAAVGWGSKPATEADARRQEIPHRAFLRTTLAQMSDEEVVRIASSPAAMSILSALPHATDGQLASIDQFLQTPASSKGR